MDLSSLEGDGQVDGLVLEEGKAHLVLNRNFQFLLLLNNEEQQAYCLKTNIICMSHLQRSSRAEEVQLFCINSLGDNA